MNILTLSMVGDMKKSKNLLIKRLNIRKIYFIAINKVDDLHQLHVGDNYLIIEEPVRRSSVE